MITFDEYMKQVVDVNGCWIYPSNTEYVEYKGERTYIIRAIFDFYGKKYDGRTTKGCGSVYCINPDHLLNHEEQFWSNIEDGTSQECWEWKSLKGTNNYSSTKWNGKSVRGHRLAYELFWKEKVPEGLDVCHTCDTPPCCNPFHLFIGTHQDNVDDRERKGRNKLPYSKGENHGQNKLTETDVKEIRDLYSLGYSYRKLSSMFNVSFGNIRKIVKKQTWAWL